MARKPARKPRRSAGGAVQAPGRPPSLQVGALCWRRSARSGPRVLLITSRDTGRWVIPKGWSMRNRTEAEAAAREAFEEAGITGEVSPRSIGIFGYLKKMPRGRDVPCVVRVYPLAVREMLRHYPEIGQRRMRWLKPAKAARKVDEPELAKLIRSFEPSP